MIYRIETYKDGRQTGIRESTKGYDWNWLDRTYRKDIDGYLHKGWKCDITGSGRDLIHSDEEMVAHYFAHKEVIIFDLKDSNGEPIRNDRRYVSDYGGIYSFNESYLGGFYLRKSEKFGRWSDVDNPTQDIVDTLKLKELK